VSNIRLLIVEDDDALAALLEEYFLEAGYAALAALKTENFDLILSDIVLPGADGLNILHEVGGQPEKTLVILMTGYSGIEDALNAVEQGAYDFVSKPFQLPEIRVRLDNAARYQLLLRKWMASQKAPLQLVNVRGQSVLRAYDSQQGGR